MRVRNHDNTFTQVAQHLSRCELFRKCSSDFISMLSNQIEPKFYQEGEEICRQGEQGDCMFILRVGRVDVEAKVNGIATNIATLHDGSIFGEMAAISKSPQGAKRTATIRAVMCCNCFMIRREALMKTLQRFPQDEVIIAAEAQNRKDDLVQRGIVEAPNSRRRWSQVCTVVRSISRMKRRSSDETNHNVWDADLSPQQDSSQSTPVRLFRLRQQQAPSNSSRPVSSQCFTVGEDTGEYDEAPQENQIRTKPPGNFDMQESHNPQCKRTTPQQWGLTQAEAGQPEPQRPKNSAATAAALALLAPVQPQQPQKVPEHLRAAAVAAAAIMVSPSTTNRSSKSASQEKLFMAKTPSRRRIGHSAWRRAVASDPACDRAFTDASRFLREREGAR